MGVKSLALGLAAGYVLGARAGRQRYELEGLELKARSGRGRQGARRRRGRLFVGEGKVLAEKRRRNRGGRRRILSL